jgi:malate dehydrogenase (oxaloacetate-decarboxylating)(NADP+)
MQGDAALSEAVRAKLWLPDSTLQRHSQHPDLPESGCGQYLVQCAEDDRGQWHHGGSPILLGAAAPVHILNPAATVRRIVNMTAVAVAHGKV